MIECILNRRRALALLTAGALVVGAANIATAQEASPVIGTWIVAVTVEGQPALVLPNLVTFAADGTVTVAAPPHLPELPGGKQEFFSSGHGAWTASGTNGADVVLAFLVSDVDGALASINTVRGAVEVDPNAKVYIGQFKLDIIDKDGNIAGSGAGTWQAKKIEVAGEGPVKMP